MGDDPGRVEPAGADEAEEIGAVPERLADQAGDRQAPQERLAGRDRERLVDEHADHDDPAGDPDDGQGGLEGGAVAGRLDDEVGALVAGDVVDGVERVLRPGVDRDRPAGGAGRVHRGAMLTTVPSRWTPADDAPRGDQHPPRPR